MEVPCIDKEPSTISSIQATPKYQLVMQTRQCKVYGKVFEAKGEAFREAQRMNAFAQRNKFAMQFCVVETYGYAGYREFSEYKGCKLYMDCHGQIKFGLPNTEPLDWAETLSQAKKKIDKLETKGMLNNAED